MLDQSGSRRIGTAALSVVLWLVTFVLGLECIYALAQLCALGYGAVIGDAQAAEAVILVLVMIFGLAFVALIIMSTEYHRKHFGKPESWRLYVWTLAAEASILFLSFLI